MSLTHAADRLADLEERLLTAGSGMERHHQVVAARRRIVWAGQWLTLARIASADSDALLAEAAAHLRKALAAIDRETA
jgi:hypothetical protein